MSRPPVCVVVADHWSYIGVGWTLGLESSVASLRDAFALAESEVGAKTSINLDAHGYERLAEEYPHVARKLRALLDRRMLDVVGGSFGQPLATTISGESNVRQLVEGRRAIRDALGFEVETFLEQEEFSHPQVPQLLIGCGYRYASLAQSDTWGRQGVPVMDVPVVDWVGADGSRIRATTRNRLCFHTWGVEWEPVLASEDFARLASHGVPLITKWEEFGWDVEAFADAQGLIRSLAGLTELADARFVTVGEYLDAWTGEVPETALRADDWQRLLAWGIGGDQLRRALRLAEGALLAAETLDAFAHMRGGGTRADALAGAWRSLMAAQSHDVALCEYTVGVLGAPPAHPREELFNASWGAIGFEKLRAARAVAERVAAEAMANLAPPLDTAGERALTVFNPAGHGRAEAVESPLLADLPDGTEGVVVVDPDDEELPAQLVEETRERDGSLSACRVLFEARVASLGAASYRLRPVREDPAPESSLWMSDDGLRLGNGDVTVEIDPVRGGIARLLDASGTPYIGAHSPRLTGDRNADFPLTSVFHYFDGPPTADRSRLAGEHRYDSAEAQAEMQRVEVGPVRATVRCVTRLDLARMETSVTVTVSSPAVRLRVRLVADVPPDPKIGNTSSDWVPVDLPADGYWLTYDTTFVAQRVVRDLPFLVQETGNERFEALTFVDLIGDDRALLLAHGGTQHFRRGSETALSNLIMREWESYFGNHFGWPPVADYDYLLLPHEPDWTNTQRIRAARELLNPLPTAWGQLPDRRQSYAAIDPHGGDLSALRTVADGDFEARFAEYEGEPTRAGLRDGDGPIDLVETDHRGEPLGTAQPTLTLRTHGVHTTRFAHGVEDLGQDALGEPPMPRRIGMDAVGEQ
ncbi:MAG: alpha-mannosidase [Solirubrobacteraceae bacterium]